MRSEGYKRSSVCARSCHDQVPDGGVGSDIKAVHCILQYTIGIGYALMLSHVVEPGIDAECLDKDTLF